MRDAALAFGGEPLQIWEVACEQGGLAVTGTISAEVNDDELRTAVAERVDEGSELPESRPPGILDDDVSSGAPRGSKDTASENCERLRSGEVVSAVVGDSAARFGLGPVGARRRAPDQPNSAIADPAQHLPLHALVAEVEALPMKLVKRSDDAEADGAKGS